MEHNLPAHLLGSPAVFPAAPQSDALSAEQPQLQAFAVESKLAPLKVIQRRSFDHHQAPVTPVNFPFSPTAHCIAASGSPHLTWDVFKAQRQATITSLKPEPCTYPKIRKVYVLHPLD